MKFDMHCHTAEGSSDSKVSIKEYISLLKEQGFDGMLVTDHDSYGGYNYYEQYLKESTSDFVVLKGIEYDTLDAGHFVVILPTYANLRILEHKGLFLKTLIKIVHSYGGILGPAHACGEPFLSLFSTGRYKRDDSIAFQFDFIEGYNCGEDDETNYKAQMIARKYGKPATGGSDAHKPDCVGLAYTKVYEPIRNNDDLIDYIKKCKPMECGGQQYMGTIKEHLGPWNKLLVYGFFPYNKAGALKHYRKRNAELNKIKWELKDFKEHHKERIEVIEKKLYDRYKDMAEDIDHIKANELYDKMREHRHHAQVSTLEHSERVTAGAAKLARKLHIKRLDWNAMLKGALLHDFYLYDWHKEDNGEHKWHGYHHADKAKENAVSEFGIGKKEQDIIHTHMWPLNITRVPKSKEAWIVCLADKYVSFKESLFGRKK